MLSLMNNNTLPALTSETEQTLATLNAENAKLAVLTRKALRDHKHFPAMQAQTKVAKAAYRAHWSLVDSQRAPTVPAQV